MGLDGILLYPNDLSTDAKFNLFYALVARETKITGVLFECQVRLLCLGSFDLVADGKGIDDSGRCACYLASFGDLVREENSRSDPCLLVGPDDWYVRC